MGLRQEWEEEAHRKGLAEGLEKGRVDVVLKLYKLRFGVASDDVRKRFENAVTKDLDRWAERLLYADSPDEVFAPES